MQSWFLIKSEFKCERELLTDHIIVKQNDAYTWFWFGGEESVFAIHEILKANDKMIEFCFGKSRKCYYKVYEGENENSVE